MVSCLLNLHKCKASCCRQFSFIVPTLTKDKKYYYELHGCKIITEKRGWDRIIVYARCDALTEDYKCSLHGKPEKPAVCKALDETTAKKELFYITEGCVLKNKEEIYELSEKEKYEEEILFNIKVR